MSNGLLIYLCFLIIVIPDTVITPIYSTHSTVWLSIQSADPRGKFILSLGQCTVLTPVYYPNNSILPLYSVLSPLQYSVPTLEHCPYFIVLYSLQCGIITPVYCPHFSMMSLVQYTVLTVVCCPNYIILSLQQNTILTIMLIPTSSMLSYTIVCCPNNRVFNLQYCIVLNKVKSPHYSALLPLTIKCLQFSILSSLQCEGLTLVC